MPPSTRESAGRPTTSAAEAAKATASGSLARERARRAAASAEERVNRPELGASDGSHEAPPDDPLPPTEGEERPDEASERAEALELDAFEADDARALHHAPSDREIDAELVRRAQAGEPDAFRQLFERYHKRVYAVAFGVLKNRQDALDCVQEGFVKVHRHLASFQGSSSFYTWLYRIVMNLAIDQLRRRKTARPVEFDDARRRDGVEPGDEAIVSRLLDENPRKAVIRRELLERVQAALAELPEYHRQVILLREIEGMSYEEMAEALEVPKGTIMSRLFHARRKMQEALKSYVDGDLELEE